MPTEPSPPEAGRPARLPNWAVAAAAVAVFGALGFAAYLGARPDPDKVLKLRVNAMKFLALAYSGYQDEHMRPPTSFADVQRVDPNLPQVLKDGNQNGRLAVRWGSRLVEMKPDGGVLAVLTDPELENKAVILTNAFEFRTVTREEYEALPDPKPALPAR